MNLVRALGSKAITAVQAGQLLSMVMLLTQPAGVAGAKESGEAGEDLWMFYAVLVVVYLLGIATGWIWSWYQSRKQKVLSCDQLRLYEARTLKDD